MRSKNQNQGSSAALKVPIVSAGPKRGYHALHQARLIRAGGPWLDIQLPLYLPARHRRLPTVDRHATAGLPRHLDLLEEITRCAFKPPDDSNS